MKRSGSLAADRVDAQARRFSAPNEARGNSTANRMVRELITLHHTHHVHRFRHVLHPAKLGIGYRIYG